MFKTIFFGAFLVFTLLSALFGMLKGRKYKWQFSVSRIILVILSTVISTVLSALSGWILGGVLVGLLNSGNIGEFINAVPSAADAIRAVIAMVVAPILFIILFNIIRALMKLLTGPICKLLMKIGAKKAADTKAAEVVGDAEMTEPLAETAEDSVESLSDERAEVKSELTYELEPKEKKEKKKKKKKYSNYRSEKKFDLIGGACGALCGFLTSIVLLIPIVGIITLTNSFVQIVVPRDNEVTEMICEVSDAAAENIGSKTVNVLGGKVVWSALTTYPVNGEWTSAPKETDFLSRTADAVMDIADKEVTRKEAADSLRTIPDSFEKSVMIPMVLSDLFSASSEKWSNGEAFCGINAPSMGEMIDPVVKDFFVIMKDSSRETIHSDFRTLVNTVALVVEGDAMNAMKDGDAMGALFKNEPLISGIMLELLNNERTSPLVGSMTNLGLSVFGDKLDIVDNNDEMYDSFVSDISAAYMSVDKSSSTALDELSEKVTEVYDSHGIALSPGVSSCIAADMLDSLDNGDEDEIERFFNKPSSSELAAFDNTEFMLLSTDSLNTIDASPLSLAETIADKTDKDTTFDELKAIISDELSTRDITLSAEEREEIAEDIAKKMISDINKGKFSYKNGVFSGNDDVADKTVRITAEDLVVEMAEVKDNKKEADAIARIFSSAMGAVDQLSEEDVETSDIIVSFGPVLDAFGDCDSMGDDVASNLLTAILQSKKVRNNIGFTLVQATDMADKINDGAQKGEDYTVLLKSLGDAVSIISTSSKSENSSAAVEELMKDITPVSAEVLQALSTPETVKNYGVSGKSAVPVSNMMSDMFGNMSEAKENGMSDEEYARESLAVSDMMSIAMSAGQSDSKSTFGEGSATNITATDFVNRATDSVVMSETLVNTVYEDGNAAKVDPLASNRSLSDEEKTELVDALDAKWKAQLESSNDESANAEYQKVLTSVAAVVNVNVAFTADGVVAAQ